MFERILNTRLWQNAVKNIKQNKTKKYVYCNVENILW